MYLYYQSEITCDAMIATFLASSPIEVSHYEAHCVRLCKICSSHVCLFLKIISCFQTAAKELRAKTYFSISSYVLNTYIG